MERMSSIVCSSSVDIGFTHSILWASIGFIMMLAIEFAPIRNRSHIPSIGYQDHQFQWWLYLSILGIVIRSGVYGATITLGSKVQGGTQVYRMATHCPTTTWSGSGERQNIWTVSSFEGKKGGQSTSN